MSSPSEFGNNLFPVFLKLEEMNLLIVGGGFVGLEKLTTVLTNSPETKIRLVASQISDDIKTLAATAFKVTLIERAFVEKDLEGIHLVIVGINDIEESARIKELVNSKRLLINVADKPALCDFYLGSVVKKGDLKIAISTNGKSPTVAKRMRELLTEVIPETIDQVLQNMNQIREKLRGDFDYKLNKLNEITKGWKDGRED